MRTKTVFSSLAEVAHVWAQQDQEHGRNGSQSLYFYNKCIYSYGSHYLLGEFIEANDGARAVIINDSGYSSSTGRHINIVQGATRQYKQFFISDTNFEAVKGSLKHFIDKLARARKPELYILPANEIWEEYKNFLYWMYGDKLPKGIKAQRKELASLMQVINGDIEVSEYKKQMAAKLAREEAKEKRRKLARAKEQINDFYNYKINYVYSLPNEILRVSADGTKIQTSQQISIDVKECRVLYKLIEAGKDVHGYKIDRYTVISCNGVLTVGCHRITKEEINKIAKQLNW